MAISSKEKLTVRQTSGNRAFVFAALAFALAGDVLAMVFLAVSGVGVKFFIFPALLIAADVIALPVAAASNFRFRYSFIFVAAYCVVVVAFTILSAVISGRDAGGEVMSAVALILLAIMHAAAVLSFVVAALKGAATGGKAVGVAAVALTVILVAAVAAYAASLFGTGFFGQGFTRPLIFSYDDEGGFYRVTGVTEGSGDTIVIPEEWNGSPVGGIDCSVFVSEGITRVELNCAANVKLDNIGALEQMSGVTVTADKSKIDVFRNRFYGAGCFAAGNSLIPTGEGTEAYAVFDYSEESYFMAGGIVLPTWTGNDISEFDIADYASDPVFAYAAHTDVRSAEDLHWASVNNNGYIMHVPTGEGNIDALITFERVYKVTIGADNDARSVEFEGDGDVAGGTRLGYRYTIAGNADELLSGYEREGFSVVWHVGTPYGTPIGSLADVLEGNYNYFSRGITVAAAWKLNDPQLSVSAPKTARYYDDWTAVVSVDPPVNGYDATISWSEPRISAAGGGAYTVTDVLLTDAGSYSVTVVTGNNEYTSLTSSASATVTLSVTPRELDVVWKLNGDDWRDNITYSGTSVGVSLAAATSGNTLKGGDTLAGNYDITNDSVIDAGSYDMTASLTGTMARKYTITNPSERLVVGKYALTAGWSGENSKTYDGTPIDLRVSAYGVGRESGTQLLTVTPQTNAGSYTATAQFLKNYGNNYEITVGKTYGYVINKRPVTFVWQGNRTFTYNGAEQRIQVTGVTGAVDSELSSLLSAVTYGAGGVNAGEYLMTVTPSANSAWKNYEYSGNTSSFTIEKLSVTLVWQTDKTLTYNGKAQRISVVDVTGAVSSEVSSLLSSLTYGAGGVNAGGYGITATPNADSAWKNYEYSGNTSSFTIEKAALTVTVYSAQKTYDGRTYSFGTGDYRVSGLCSGDNADVEFVGDAVTATNAGSYGFTAEVSLGADENNYNVTVNYVGGTSGTLTIGRAPLIVTVYNAQKTYDGTAYTFGDGGYDIKGLVAGDSASVTLSGAALTATNAGKYDITAQVSLGEDAGNYTVSIVKGTLTINKAVITVTIHSIRKTYDGAAYSFTGSDYEISGVVSDDRADVTLTGAAVGATNAGTYVITAQADLGADAGNYTVSIVKGTLTINKAVITVTIHSIRKTYDGAAYSFTGSDYEISGVVSDDRADVTLTGAAVGATNAGTYDITAQVSLGADAGNYTVNVSGGTLTIDKRPVTLVWQTDKTLTYNGKVQRISVVDVTGAVSSEVSSLLSSLTYGAGGVNAGEYNITATPNADSAWRNYEYSGNTSSFTIGKAALTVTVHDAEKTYDGEVYAFGAGDYEISGLCSGDSATVDFIGDAVTATDAGRYGFTAEVSLGADENNYNVTVNYDGGAGGTLTITQPQTEGSADEMQ